MLYVNFLGGGDKKIPSQRLDFKAKAHPKIDFGKKENGSAANSRPTTPVSNW